MQEANSASSARTIMVVDDDDQLKGLLRKSLEKAGYSVLTANDGVEGLELLKSEMPDLIISDVKMPRMDGWQFCRVVRSSCQLKAIPFIFLSVMNKVDERILGLKCGADAYVMKPFHMNELLAWVSSMFRMVDRLHGANGSNGAGSDEAPVAEDAVKQTRPMNNAGMRFADSLVAEPFFKKDDREPTREEDVKFQEGFTAFRSKDYRQALDLWEENLRLYPRHIGTKRYLEIVKGVIGKLVNQELGAETAVPALNTLSRRNFNDLGLSRQEYHLMSLVNGQSTVRDIVSMSSMDRYRTYLCLVDLLRKRVILIKQS
ncbi:response regulator [bacterium]|nr:response regulator [candidate division CSSED10-310 bacterium]